LVIDRHSCKDLELISNARTGSQKEGTLYGIINKTKTDVGAKALKANLLAPLTDKVTIEGRLALIELFIAGGVRM
jgi:DNA mismatch repair ATPase MutS